MTSVGRVIFRAIHEGKWVSLEYKNKTGQTTHYWLGIRSMDLRKGQITGEGLHLGQLTVLELTIYMERILSAEIVEGSWCEIDQKLLRDIQEHPKKYEAWFGNSANLRVLEYLAFCNKLDSVPYTTQYQLIEHLDLDQMAGGTYALSDEQFALIVRTFQRKTEQKREKHYLQMTQIGINLLSVDTPRGLYVLAYRPLMLDVASRTLRLSETLVICREYTLQGEKVSAHSFMNEEDFALLEEFERNAERIKDCITKATCTRGVNDMPYLVAVGRNNLVDLEHEYKGITAMFDPTEDAAATQPIRAFFGEMNARPRRRKSFPLALISNQVNLDQLLAINNAMRYPLTYVQGPPGTGKTSTIVNTMTTAFFNERTVLFTSYNNHPIDGVVQKLSGLTYRGKKIPFPIARLGSADYVAQTLHSIYAMYQSCKQMTIYEKTLDRNHAERAERARKLTERLEQYDEMLDLQERKETIQRLLETSGQKNFQRQLRSNQLAKVDRELEQCSQVHAQDALELLDQNTEDLLKYLYYTSAKYIRRLGEPKNRDLLEILSSGAPDQEKVAAFHRYLSETENLKKFLRIFPFVATTCISAHRLGEPQPSFDMVIMDEASQCNTATALLPILRGNSLMLVGDPQQLQPVIVLDPHHNQILRRRYRVGQEYDYIENSIYKCLLSCDAVSDEVLLRYHYRCDPKIIGFNNRKYYNRRLRVASKSVSKRPLVYVDVPHDTTQEKNTAPREVEVIDRYLAHNPGRSVGIITPFTNQKNQIEQMIQERGYEHASCGTVHAFQGDEKDVVIFSLALTDKTGAKTYDWLKNNKELINVATSRAKEQLILLSNKEQLNRLHQIHPDDDDLYDLYRYVCSEGSCEVAPKPAASRALGIKPYSTKTEDAFLENLNHALGNIFIAGGRCSVHREVPIAHVFKSNPKAVDLFYTGRFDFVVYQKEGRQSVPVLAIELDGREHREDPAVQKRDQKKDQLCKEHGFELIRVDNTYARRYHYIKEILIGYFHQGQNRLL